MKRESRAALAKRLVTELVEEERMVESVSQHIGFAGRILRDNDASPEEQRVTCLWAAARTTMDAAEKEVERYFMGRLAAALNIHDFDEADALLRRCPPDTVTKVFMMDQIREARKPTKR